MKSAFFKVKNILWNKNACKGTLAISYVVSAHLLMIFQVFAHSPLPDLKCWWTLASQNICSLVLKSVSFFRFCLLFKIHFARLQIVSQRYKFWFCI